MDRRIKKPGNAGGNGGNSGNAPQEWYSRGYLPHRDVPELIQSITFRLADSLPQKLLKSLKEDLRRVPEHKQDAERRRRIEAWLDAGMGCCALRHPEVARYMENSFKHFHGDRYLLHAWCIMPNHEHILITPHQDLATIVQGWKSYTSAGSYPKMSVWVLASRIRIASGCGIIGIAIFAMRNTINLWSTTFTETR